MAEDRFAVIYTNGRAENLCQKSWFSVLDFVFAQACAAGAGDALPDKLFRNGDMVCTGLHKTAHSYGLARAEARLAAEAKVENRYPEPWTCTGEKDNG